MATVKVWDIAVRVFHWSLLIAFVTAYLSGEENEFVHTYAGYIVLGLVVFRVPWGVIGSRHARFADFVYSPTKILAYTRTLASGSPQRYLGHNPLGGAMVVALLISLSLTCLSGLEAYAVEGKGPLTTAPSRVMSAASHADSERRTGAEHKHGDNEGEGLWEEIHEFCVNITLGLVILHIAGVGLGSLLHKEKLVQAMITGRKEQ